MAGEAQDQAEARMTEIRQIARGLAERLNARRGVSRRYIERVREALEPGAKGAVVFL